jgi:hypothetical protein
MSFDERSLCFYWALAVVVYKASPIGIQARHHYISTPRPPT